MPLHCTQERRYLARNVGLEPATNRSKPGRNDTQSRKHSVRMVKPKRNRRKTVPFAKLIDHLKGKMIGQRKSIGSSPSTPIYRPKTYPQIIGAELLQQLNHVTVKRAFRGGAIEGKRVSWDRVMLTVRVREYRDGGR